MQVTPITCAVCSKRLFEAVQFCPYCGVATASAISEHIPATPVPTDRVKTGAKAVEADGVSVPSIAESELPSTQISEQLATAAANTTSVPPPSKTTVPPSFVPAASGTSAAAKAPPTPEPSRSKLLIATVVALVVVLAGYWLSRPNEKEIACNAQLASAAEMLAAGDAAGARGQSLLALASCDADSRSSATELKAAADKALVVLANCEKGLRRAESLIGERRLQSAVSTLNQLDTACSDAAQAKKLRLLLDAGQSAADSAEADTRQKLKNSDMMGARASLDQLSAVNREHPEIAALRMEIQNMAKAQDAAAAAAPAPAPAPARAAFVAPSPVPALPEVPVRNNAAFASQQALVNGFLRDAEVALSELKFDKAKTYVESARRIDPNNSQAAVLARVIRDRELAYARREMTIN